MSGLRSPLAARAEPGAGDEMDPRTGTVPGGASQPAPPSTPALGRGSHLSVLGGAPLGLPCGASQSLPAPPSSRWGRGDLSRLLELITVIIPALSSALVPFVPRFLPAHLQI